MAELKSFRVFGDDGPIGTLRASARFLDNRTEKQVTLDDGNTIQVPSADLEVQPDGSFYLRRRLTFPASQPAAPEQQLPPPDAEPEEPLPQVVKPNILGSFFSEDYTIERVSIGRIVQSTPEQRQEGDTLVLPVVEEILVSEKKILLQEEIRITRRRKAVTEIRQVTSSDLPSS
ncbi:MAG: DUF2382 domain-containing protein [Acidobacteriota bacterium]|nr:DUF2382 domain-containing protein [Acidobacteriota bacterium]